jgi:uncharacterized membrane protein YccC
MGRDGLRLDLLSPAADGRVLEARMIATLATMLALAASEPQFTPHAEKPKLICREGDQELGSHIRSGRRCKTAEEWQQEDERATAVPTTLRVVAGHPDGTPTAQRPPL